MVSKYGSARKTSRRIALRPQAVSRVPSLRSARRAPLPMRDWSFLNPLPPRRSRWPATTPTFGSRSRIDTIAGTYWGSFWPSPSRVTRRGARAARAPVHSAALLPQLSAWRTTRRPGRGRARGGEPGLRVVGRAVVHIDDLERREAGARVGDVVEQRLDRG